MNKLSPEERARLESEERCLMEDLNHKSLNADYHIVQYISKLAIAMKKAGKFAEIGFEEPFAIDEYDLQRESIRNRIREIRKILEEDE